MQALFGIPLDILMQRLLVATVAAAVVVILLALRRPILLKIGLRNVPRRRARMFLIIFGLMLATTFISAALAVGDTISTAVRSVAVFNYGRVDEVISGGHGDLGLFPQYVATQVEQQLAGDPDVAGVAPALQEDGLLLADETSRQVRSGVTALAIPPGAEVGFDGMRDIHGMPLLSGVLGPNEVYVNRALGLLLNAHGGDTLYVYSLRWPGQRFQFTVRGVIEKSGLVGDLPTFILPLSTLQHIEKSPYQINRIFIANRGDGLSGAHLSDAVTDRLNAFLPPYLTVHEVKQEGIQLSEKADDLLTRIFTLFALFSLSIGVLLIFLIFVLLAAERRSEMGIERAIGMQRGQLVRLFLFEGAFYDLIASLIGIAAGVALGVAIVAFISPTLARIGFPLNVQPQPRSLIIAYCLGALFTLGTIIISSWLVSRMTIVYAMRDLPEPPRRPTPLAVLLSRFLVRLLDAFGLGESKEAPWHAVLRLPGNLLALCWGLIIRGIAPFVLGWILLEQGIAVWQALFFSLGLSLLVIGGALLLRWVILWMPALYRAVGPVSRARCTDWVRLERRCWTAGNRIAAAIAGLGLLLYWALPYDVLVSLGFPRFTGGIEVFFISGVMMVFGAIWALAFNIDLLLIPVIWLLRGLRRLGFILHTALVYPLHYRFRTGVNLVMFTLVIFTMTVMAVISNSLAHSYGDIRRYTGGFDIQGQPFFQPISNMRAAIQHAPGVNPDDIASISTQTTSAVSVLQLSARQPEWKYYPINVVDGGFLDGLGGHLVARAAGFATDADVWKALRDHPGYALIDSRALPAAPGSLYTQDMPSLAPDELTMLEALYNSTFQQNWPLPDDYEEYLYRFSGAWRGDATIPATPVWLADVRGGPAIKVTIIGVVDNSDGMHYGLVTSPQTFAPAEAGLGPLPIQTQRYYFKLRPGVDPHAEALALGSAFLDYGLETTVLTDLALNVNGPRIFLSQMLIGVVGLTLLLGVAALAVTGTRAVVERRQQIGMLRALGYQRWAVQLAFLLEFFLIGVAGTLVGLVLGLILCRNVFAANFFEQYQTGLELVIPWGELGIIALCAFAATLLAAFLPAWQAGRVAPADALRYE